MIWSRWDLKRIWKITRKSFFLHPPKCNIYNQDSEQAGLRRHRAYATVKIWYLLRSLSTNVFFKRSRANRAKTFNNESKRTFPQTNWSGRNFFWMRANASWHLSATERKRRAACNNIITSFHLLYCQQTPKEQKGSSQGYPRVASESASASWTLFLLTINWCLGIIVIPRYRDGISGSKVFMGAKASKNSLDRAYILRRR